MLSEAVTSSHTSSSGQTESQTSSFGPLSLNDALRTPDHILNFNTKTVELVTPRLVTSYVWDFFGKYPDHIVNKANIVVCKRCRDALAG